MQILVFPFRKAQECHIVSRENYWFRPLDQALLQDIFSQMKPMAEEWIGGKVSGITLLLAVFYSVSTGGPGGHVNIWHPEVHQGGLATLPPGPPPEPRHLSHPQHQAGRGGGLAPPDPRPPGEAA